MSRYLLLFLLCLPFVLASIVSLLARFRMGTITKNRFIIHMVFWVVVLLGLALAEPIYDWLVTTGLTQTDSLSLFDVVQLTGIVVVFYIANRTRSKLERVERRLNDLHQELSILNAKSPNDK